MLKATFVACLIGAPAGAQEMLTAIGSAKNHALHAMPCEDALNIAFSDFIPDGMTTLDFAVSFITIDTFLAGVAAGAPDVTGHWDRIKDACAKQPFLSLMAVSLVAHSARYYPE